MAGNRTAELADHRERGDVMAWRQLRLLDAGFGEELASRLAATPGVDLHALLDLVNRGCPPELADRILSPLNELDPTA
jgi:hypothetical protein